MSDTDDNLEDELRALLSRVLSAQLDGLAGRVADLALSVGTLSNTCKDLHKKYSSDLITAQNTLTDILEGNLAKDSATLAQHVERVHGALAETRAAISVQAKEVQRKLAGARDAMVAQSKAQAGALTDIVTSQADVLGLAVNAVQRHAEDRGEALDKSIARLAQAVEETNTLMRSRLSDLEHKIARLTGLGITAIIVLVATIASTGAIYVLVHPGFP